MYPFPTYLFLRILDEERLGQTDVYQQMASLQRHRPVARALAHTLGHALKAAGTRLEQYGQ
ncbi:MAG TPA: hypothetical protein VKV40_07015 [Ktedonobacteraceae bacterium]|nr:hypothetical protein [Ktedonobacteraceae bacterium]